MSKNTTQWASQGSNLKFTTSSQASLPLGHNLIKSLVQAEHFTTVYKRALKDLPIGIFELGTSFG